MTDFRYLEALRTAGAARKVVWHGREHWVVPVVALMEGVIHAVNASDAEFVPFKTLSQNVTQWNGRPLMLGHPTRDGVHIAANDPSVLEASSFGSIFNARIENARLMMDAYVDPARLIALGRPDVLKRVMEGKPIEISIGAQVATNTTAGEHNGRKYKSSWMALAADHLAFLPDGRGACSLEMGCGAHRAMAAQEDLMAHPLVEQITKAVMSVLGGKGSGNFGHEGRPGMVGGSGDGEGGSSDADRRKNDGYEGSSTPVEGDRVVVKSKVHGQGEKGTVTGGGADGAFVYVRGDDGKPMGSYHVSDLKVDDDDYDDSMDAREDDVPEKGSRSDKRTDSSYSTADKVVEHDVKIVKGVGRNAQIAADFLENEAMNLPKAKFDEVKSISKELDKIHQDMKFFRSKNTDVARVNELIEGLREFAPKRYSGRLKALGAAYKDCPTCAGSGNVDGNPCEACDGNGELKVASSHEETEMKKDLIDKLVACSCSGFTKDDITALEGFSETRLKALADAADEKMATKTKEEEDAEAEKKKKDAAFKAAEAAKQTLEQKVTALETELRAASSKVLSEDEFLQRAPASVRALVEDKRAQDAAEATVLVATLKVAAAAAYTEAELTAMPLDQLRKLAAIAKIDAPRYEGRGVPALRSAAETTDYNPPSAYDMQLKALQAKTH